MPAADGSGTPAAAAKLGQPLSAGGRPESSTATQQQQQQQQQQQELIDVIGSQLVIEKVDKDDEGKYTCLVETKGSHRLIERESQSGQLIASGKCPSIQLNSFSTRLPLSLFRLCRAICAIYKQSCDHDGNINRSASHF